MEQIKYLFAMLGRLYDYPGGLVMYRARVEEGLSPNARNLLALVIDGMEIGIREPNEVKRNEIRDMLLAALDAEPMLVKEIKTRGVFVLLEDMPEDDLARAERYLKVMEIGAMQ